MTVKMASTAMEASYNTFDLADDILFFTEISDQLQMILTELDIQVSVLDREINCMKRNKRKRKEKQLHKIWSPKPYHKAE